jgi:hypothetical protein
MYGKTGKMRQKTAVQVRLKQQASRPIWGLKKRWKEGRNARIPGRWYDKTRPLVAQAGALHESARAATMDSGVLRDSGKGKPAALQNATPKGTKPKLWTSRKS